MACNAHENINICNVHNNKNGGQQPCPSNVLVYPKAILGYNVIAERLIAVRNELYKEENRRNFKQSQYANDIYISALIHSNNIKELRKSLDEMVDKKDYCWCNCNHSSCICDSDSNIYCSCDCHNCTCNCNYCPCNCNYCTCNCNYCTCNCNNCRCNCNRCYCHNWTCTGYSGG